MFRRSYPDGGAAFEGPIAARVMLLKPGLLPVFAFRRPGGFCGAIRPDPIPNSAVKRFSANGTMSQDLGESVAARPAKGERSLFAAINRTETPSRSCRSVQNPSKNQGDLPRGARSKDEQHSSYSPINELNCVRHHVCMDW